MKSKLFLIFAGIFLISLVCAADVSYCCERLESGAWCQNALEESCDGNYRSAPTSCESTSYCKLGTCVDSSEGTCMDNTPQKVCDDNEGVWYDADSEDVPQCSLGCCLIGDQAAFVTQTRCKRLSAIYGLETNFRTDISSEISCIASASSDAMGACVFEEDYETTCLMLTQAECNELEEASGNVSFHEDYLCSDEDLATNCGPSEQTTCVDGEDEVYFLDTCGNVANIYDSTKINDKEYWSKIYDKSDSCNDGSSNANSKTCGNCDYYLGSTCKSYDRAEDDSAPRYGNYICRDLSCEYEGKTYQHGETWCADSDGVENNLPGSRYFRLVCYNSEVSVEPCADYRAEVCIESDIDGFKTAACRANEWQDCVSQTNKQDCENADRRDCVWMGDACFPEFAPGFDFWESDSEAEDICAVVNEECTVVFETKLSGGRECVENCECLTSSWLDEKNEQCIALGDCGSKTNYIGAKGYHDEKAYYSGDEESEDEE